MAPQLILPTSARREAQQSPRPEVTVYVQVAVVFEGAQSDDAALVEVLKTLQRDNVLFMCAYLNTVVSGFGALDSKERQELALSTICRGDQRDKINIFAASRGAAGLPTVFFRGQMLELMRWAARYCERTPGGGRAFEDPDVLGRFFKGALIASDVWSRRVYGDKLAGDGNANDVRRRALGALRKGSEESNPASHPGVSMGRGRSLFTAYMPRADPHFPDAFRAATGLTIEDYLVAAAALLTYTFARRAEGTIFNSRTVAAATAFQQAVTRFVELESQRPDDLEDALWRDFEKSGYLGIRNAPILVRHDGLAIILDPTMFYEKKISVGPLFYAVRSASTGKRGSVNKVFGAFGGAFEDYASDMLRRMYPSRPGLVDRVTFGAEGRDASGREFEVDASMVDPRSGINNAIVFEMKAAFLREDAILSDDVDEQFVDEIRSKYGRSLGNRDRDKGVAQLAKIIGAIIREEWVGKYREFVAVSLIFPVLIVHDSRLDAPGLSWFLKDDFMRLLGIEPKGTRVAPLTILTVDDLENLESSVGAFTLIEALRDYDEEYPDRMRSFGNFLARSKYAKLIKPSEHVMHQSDELLEQVQRSLFPGTQCGGG